MRFWVAMEHWLLTRGRRGRAVLNLQPGLLTESANYRKSCTYKCLDANARARVCAQASVARLRGSICTDKCVISGHLNLMSGGNLGGGGGGEGWGGDTSTVSEGGIMWI